MTTTHTKPHTTKHPIHTTTHATPHTTTAVKDTTMAQSAQSSSSSSMTQEQKEAKMLADIKKDAQARGAAADARGAQADVRGAQADARIAQVDDHEKCMASYRSAYLNQAAAEGVDPRHAVLTDINDPLTQIYLAWDNYKNNYNLDHSTPCDFHKDHSAMLDAPFKFMPQPKSKLALAG